jgi:hypothetical protein
MVGYGKEYNQKMLPIHTKVFFLLAENSHKMTSSLKMKYSVTIFFFISKTIRLNGIEN